MYWNLCEKQKEGLLSVTGSCAANIGFAHAENIFADANSELHELFAARGGGGGGRG